MIQALQNYFYSFQDSTVPSGDNKRSHSSLFISFQKVHSLELPEIANCSHLPAREGCCLRTAQGVSSPQRTRVRLSQSRNRSLTLSPKHCHVHSLNTEKEQKETRRRAQQGNAVFGTAVFVWNTIIIVTNLPPYRWEKGNIWPSLFLFSLNFFKVQWMSLATLGDAKIGHTRIFAIQELLVQQTTIVSCIAAVRSRLWGSIHLNPGFATYALLSKSFSPSIPPFSQPAKRR